MDDIIEKINNVLRFQMTFQWNHYKNSFNEHVQKHPIGERHKYIYGDKWKTIINYANYETIAKSYYKVSTELAQKFDLIPIGKYDVQYIEEHQSVNIVDLNNGLIVCLKYNHYKNCFIIATCFFPSKINDLFSIKTKIFSQYHYTEKEKATDYLYFVPYNKFDNNNINRITFKEAMEDFFGSNSIEYQILFKNYLNNDIYEFTNTIKKEIDDYLENMTKLIKNEYDKEYYFVFNDGIGYIAKWTLLYKIKDNNYEELYQKFLNIDINNVYKDALDLCKKYIDEGEEKNERGN